MNKLVPLLLNLNRLRFSPGPLFSSLLFFSLLFTRRWTTERERLIFSVLFFTHGKQCLTDIIIIITRDSAVAHLFSA